MRVSCARCQDLLCKIALSGSLHQDPVGPLVQDLSFRISCARSLYEDLLRKVFVARSPQQDYVGALVQDQCMRISCARSLCHLSRTL